MALHKHRTESKSRENEKWLAATLKSIGDAVITTDIKGLVTFMNSVAEALTGWKQEDALDRNLTEVFNIINGKTRTLTKSPAAKALRKGDIVDLENHTTLIAKDGIETPILDSAAPIRDGRGSTTGVVLVFRNITQRKWAKETLRASVKKYHHWASLLLRHQVS